MYNWFELFGVRTSEKSLCLVWRVLGYEIAAFVEWVVEFLLEKRLSWMSVLSGIVFVCTQMEK